MQGILGSIPVVLSILISTFIPFSWLGPLQKPFEEGRFGMRLILFAFLVSLYLIVERMIKLMKIYMENRSFMARVKASLEAGDIDGARSFCEQTGNKPLARIIGAGLAHSNRGIHHVQAAMDEVAYIKVPEIEKRTGYLALMGNVATLMGLFGTILGLIESFSAVSKGNAADNATRLAAGISEAMNCTAFGLFTGIMALLAFSILNGRTQTILDELNLYTHQAFRWWKNAYRKQRNEQPAYHVQPIGAPHPHLRAHTGLLKSKGHGVGKKGTFASLQLTPLIDMFIVILIFLLMSFSASGEIAGANKDIKVPLATNAKELQRVPIIAISYPKDDPTGGIVTLDTGSAGVPVATAKELLEDKGLDWKIEQLTEGLAKAKENWKTTNPGKPFLGQVIVQCDQKVDFKIIKKVMYSAGLAGYGSLMFAVRKDAKKEAGGEG